MIYLLLAICCSSLINWIFRLFDYYEIKPFPAIISNYLTCSILGQLLAGQFVFAPEQYTSNYFPFAIALGLLFIGVFFSMARTTAEYGISVNAVSAKMALVFPTLFFFFYLNENISVLQWVGIGLALLAVLFIKGAPKKSTSSGRNLVFPLVVFIGSGIIDTGMKWMDVAYLKGASPDMPTTTIFTGAFLAGLLILAIGYRQAIRLKDILAGICLGVPNYFSIYFLLLALQSLPLSTGAVFAGNNVGVILLSAIGGIFFFRERLSPKQYMGLALSFITILIMYYAI